MSKIKRSLHKIIFLNSAHIPYAEVKLDGNVHFIGTQGVGKSTLLRAILFFYNADKLRLGIPREKRNFDDFYLPYPNSYIVYEVMRENGAYCMLAAKSQGRTFFRVIDAPYHREWFLNDRNEVLIDFGAIRQKIETVSGKVFISSQITNYEEYRDIIFGNNRRAELGAYRRFAIVESSNYQNIPRTIQNVFLNSKLEADFIKDTIIRSSSEDEISIDIDYFRNQIKDFEQEYVDVSRWFTKNRNGEVPVRKQAEKAINAYRNLAYTLRQIDNARAELNYAEKQARQLLPLIKEDMARHNTEYERLKRLETEEGQKYNKERDALNKDLGGVESYLKAIRDKRAEYEQMGIEEMVRRIQSEAAMKLEEKQLTGIITELTKAYQDVISRFRTLEEKLEVGFQTQKNEREKQIMVQRTSCQTEKDRLMNILRNNESRIRTAAEELTTDIGLRIQQLRDDKNNILLQKQKTTSEHPHQKEIKECEEKLASLQDKEKDTTHEIDSLQNEMNRLRSQCELELKGLEMEFEAEKERQLRSRQETDRCISSLQSLLDKRKGSLCEWLEQHKPGWEHTFGKVAEEEAVLYNNELNPILEEDSNLCVFGVKLNLEAIDRTIRTPEEISKEIEQWQKTRSTQTQTLDNLAKKHEEEVADLKAKLSQKIRKLSDNQQLLKAELMRIPSLRKNIMADLVTWNAKEKEWQRTRLEELERKQEETAHLLHQAEEELKKAKEERNRKLTACQKEFKTAEKKCLEEAESFEEVIRNEIKQLEQQKLTQITQLRKQQEDELNGKGADTSALKGYQDRLETVGKELHYIETNREKVWAYQKDKKEYLEREPEMRSRKKELETKLATLRERFDNRREKLRQQLCTVTDAIQQKKKELTAIEEGLKKVEAFRNDAVLCPNQDEEGTEQPTRKSCVQLVDELKSAIISLNKKKEELQKAVNQFNSNFSNRNTFHFRTTLTSEEDYYDFAVNLCEFIDNDKITDYQKRISERYTDILGRISREVGTLTSRESEIAKTIGDINKDFVERNFAGVIKEIALRSTPSSDKLMLILLEIKKFYDEKQMEMGEMDLFSQASGSREANNEKAVNYLLAFMKQLNDDPARKRITLSDTFKLEFRIKENDNDTGWVEKISNVGSDGTDILVKAMVNIMLINVFKEKASRKFGEFVLHCMMDEIGKLHPNNVKGILRFANCRNIYLVNSSPTTYNVEDYRYTYLLKKDSQSNTQIVPLLSYNHSM